MPTFTTACFRVLSFCLFTAVLSATVQAQELPTRFIDGAAREILSQMKAGDGWIVVSQRAPLTFIPGAPAADCVKYRVVTNYRASMTNDQFVVVLEYSAETPWIMVELGLPTNSGTALAAAKLANEAITKLDIAIAGLEAPIGEEADAQVQLLGKQLLNVLRGQRAALADVIQKDVEAVRFVQ